MSALTLIYRDAHLVVIDKPSGLLVHRSDIDRHETEFAVQRLRDQIGRHVFPAHRLDRGTSGLLVFALDASTAAALGRQFESQSVDKGYLAVVRGIPQAEGVIDHALRRVEDAYLPGDRGLDTQAAQTRYRRLGQVELPWAVDRYPTSRYALLALEPLTGRRHQLRRHLKHISHPIIGDATYGNGRHNRAFAAHFGAGRLLLHCFRLAFDHPASGRRVALQAAPGGVFAAAMDAFGWTLPD